MNKEFLNFLKQYLAHNDDALLWVLSYITLCHAIDDIHDNPVKDNEYTQKVFDYAHIVYSSVFYIQHIHILYPLIRMAGNSYADSLAWEKSSEKWKRNYADVLRQNANEVVLAVVEIVNNVDIRRKASLELREISYYSHHNKLGEPC